MSEIRDESLWESGKRKIEWVRQNMSLLRSVEEDFKRDQLRLLSVPEFFLLLFR